MIAKVVPERGARAGGLVEYLFGPGRFNEHQNPRVVAAWDPTFVRSASAAVLEKFERQLMAREMEAPMRLHGIEPGDHVYHVPVAIEAEAGALSDDQWNQVAQEAAEKLGFTEGPDRAAVPWIAVRHGLNERGCDHIHFVAVLYRENGEKVTPWNDYRAWEEVRHAAEDRWNLRSTRKRGGGIPDLKRGEIERAKRERLDEPERVQLARTVRAVAGAARSEAEFVHRLRHSGVIVRPRWAQGDQTQVVGFSVALRPTDESRKPIWFGGGKLADDLTLTELRVRWGSPSEAVAADSLRAWRPRGWRDLPTGRAIVRTQLRAEAWEIAGAKTAEVRAALAAIDPRDHAAWSSVAGEAASALGALANRVDRSVRPEIRRASTALAHAAQRDRGVPRREVPELAPLVGVIRTATDAAIAGKGGPVAVASLIIQLGRLVQAVQKANEAAGRAAEAHQAAEATSQMLEAVRKTPRQMSEPEVPTPMSQKLAHRDLGEVERPATPAKEKDDGREHRS